MQKYSYVRGVLLVSKDEDIPVISLSRDWADCRLLLVPFTLLSLVNGCGVTVATGAERVATEDNSVCRAIMSLHVCFIVWMMAAIQALTVPLTFFVEDGVS